MILIQEVQTNPNVPAVVTLASVAPEQNVDFHSGGKCVLEDLFAKMGSG